MRLITLTFLLPISLSAAAASVYQCEDDEGRKVFSDTPCGDSATKVQIDPVAPMYGGEQQQPGQSEQYRNASNMAKRRMLQTRIRNTDSRIQALTKERDEVIAEYRLQMIYSARDASGIARNQQLQMLVDAAREHYDGKISDKRAERTELQQQLEEIQ
jgi:hypothetical protein